MKLMLMHSNYRNTTVQCRNKSRRDTVGGLSLQKDTKQFPLVWIKNIQL